MNLMRVLSGRKTYLDSNTFIYSLQGYPPFVTQFANLFPCSVLSRTDNSLTPALPSHFRFPEARRIHVHFHR